MTDETVLCLILYVIYVYLKPKFLMVRELHMHG